MSAHPVIRLRELWKSFGAQAVLQGINLDIEPGKMTVIVGKSGEGKSVLLKHVLGLVAPDRGQIEILGQDSSRFDERAWNAVRLHFGVLFQNGALFDSMTVFENVAFPLIEARKFSEDQVRKIALEKLALVGLCDAGHKMPAELSGGMRKRAALARAITLDPEILLWDEPTTGLDPIMSDTIYALMREMQSKLAITSLVISHDMEGALAIADRIALLDKGKIAVLGSPEEILQSAHPVIRAFFHKGTSENRPSASLPTATPPCDVQGVRLGRGFAGA